MKKIISMILSITLLLALTGCSPKLSIEEQISLGDKYLLDLDYENALLTYEEVINAEPNNIIILNKVLDIYTETGDTVKSEEYQNKIEEITEQAKDQEPEKNEDGTIKVVYTTEKEEQENGEYIETEYSSTYLPIKERIYNADGSIAHMFKYNKSGNIIKQTLYNADGSIDIYEMYEYNKNDNLISRTLYNADGSIDQYSKSEYAENGNLLNIISYNSDESIDMILSFDGNGNMLNGTQYNSDGSISSITEFDVNGNILNSTQYNSDESISSITEYDENGNIIKQTIYNSDGNKTIIEHRNMT